MASMGGRGGEKQESEVEIKPPTDGPARGGRPRAAEAIEQDRAERVAGLEARIAELEAALNTAQHAAEAAARRAEIQRELAAAGAIDPEITIPLVEEAMAGADAPDAASAVRSVRAARSFLFRPLGGGGVKSEAMAGGSPVAPPGLDELASEARESGVRGDLLRYLRARRN